MAAIFGSNYLGLPAELYMEYCYKEKSILLQGQSLLHVEEDQSHQLRRLTQTESFDQCFQLFFMSGSASTETHEQSIPAPLDSLLELYQDVFLEPNSLPPHRIVDHSIHLLPHTKPVNVKPYRYPHSQKAEIERLVTEMLDSGIIRHIQSPFSPRVLLVKKKYGTWRFCVDYRALNLVTIKYKFHIPTIDELLNELHGATIFSKLDLRAGYHQIRVNPLDILKTPFRTRDGHFEF